MENASKALLMAGGILLVMLIIALLIFSWSKFTEFYSNDDELTEIDNISKFNLQFTNYENRDVYGYELISLANKVADYNMRYSNAEGAKNDEKYTPITMKIYLNGKSDQLNFGKIDANGIRLYKNKQNSYFAQYNITPMEQSSTINNITNIIKNATGVETFYGNSSETTKLAKSIGSLILTSEQITYNENNRHMSPEQSKLSAVEAYKAIIKSDENITYEEMIKRLTGSESNILKYYEFYQFKRGIFKCRNISDNNYDNVSGRIKLIEFEFTGNIE